MQLIQVVGLVVRLFAVFLVVYNLRYANSVIGFAVTRSPDFLGSALTLILGFIPMAVAILLWMFPLAIASKLVPEIKNTSTPNPVSKDELQIVAFSVLGLWILMSAIPDTFYWMTFVYRVNAIEIGKPQLSPENIAAMVSTGIELALGIWLLFGSQGISGLVRRFRYAGA